MTITDLPRELECEILSRVPPTSLHKFRSTCRRWYALFKNPRFIEKNLGKAKRQFILKKDFSVYSVNLNLHGINNKRFDPSIEFTGKLNSLKDSEQTMIHAIFQCEGLFLCTTKDKRIVVWNPCTGQTRWIRIQPRNDDHLAYDSYALGYGNNKNKYSCDSFKILRCRTHKNNNLGIWVMEFELYYFNTDSWRLLDEDAQRNLTVSWRWMITSHGVSLKGNTYWVAWDKKEPNDIQFLLRFDFKRERFEHFSLPFSGSGTMFLSVVREEKLAVLLDRPNFDSSREMKIWVTDTKIDEAVTDMEYVLVVDFSRVLRRGMTVVSFLVDEENERVVCSGRDTKKGNKNVIYIVGGDGNHKHSCKQILGEIAQGPADDCWPFLDSYVPSSVQIQQVEAANAKGD